MPKNSDLSSIRTTGTRKGPRFWLQVSVGVLALLNLIAILLYVFPPGGSERQLADESVQIQHQIAGLQAQTGRLRLVSGNVQKASTQSSEFESKYFLPRRLAYEAVISEIQRIAKASGLKDRDAVNTEEPIEGTADLSLLNVTANFEGSYSNLMRFLYEADRSPMLLMIDNLQAAPQQKGGQINAAIRFQAVIREDGSSVEGGAR